jgi:NADH:ubiquinone oxidoreductase subunit K
MSELLIIDDLCYSALEISFEEDAKVLYIGLFSHIGSQFCLDLLQKSRLILLCIELRVVHTDNLIVKTALTLMQVYKLIWRAKEEGIVSAIYYQIHIAFHSLQLSRHQKLRWHC